MTYSGSLTRSTPVRTQISCFGLLLPKEGAEPYWYARVIGIYHANVWAEKLNNSRRQEMPGAWISFGFVGFGDEPGYHSGFRQARLPKIGFVESTDEFAFSFCRSC